MQKLRDVRDVRNRRAPGIEILFVIAALAVTAVAINFKILRDGIIFETHDLVVHLRWLQHFSHQMAEGSLYPRWLGGLNFGYGSPAFVFYPPAAMYLGTAIKALGLNAERALAALQLLAAFAAGVGFYLFGQLRWRMPASLVGAIAYMAAPYMIYNAYHRGALAEILAVSLLPFGVFLTERLIRFGRGWLALTLWFALLSLTHLPSLLLYSIAWTIYILGWVIVHRLSFKRMFSLATAPAFGFGLSSFYLLPAVLEKKLVNLDQMRSVSGGFAANLLPLIGGAPEGMSGHLMSIFRYSIVSTVICLGVAVVMGVIAVKMAKKPPAIASASSMSWVKRGLLWLIGLIAVGFLMTTASYGLWAVSPTLQMVQFPWRLMGLFVFISAGSFGLAVEALYTFWGNRQKFADAGVWKRTWSVLLAAGLLLCLFGWNTKYAYVLGARYHGFYVPGDIAAARADNRWQARSYDRASMILNDPFSGQLGEVSEYLPLLPDSKVVVEGPLRDQPPITVERGQAILEVEQWKGNYRRFSAGVSQPSELHIRTYNYPAWHAYINGQPIPIKTTSKGSIGLGLEPGDYTVELRYQATSAMKFGGALSLLSALGVGVISLKRFVGRRRRQLAV